MVVRNRQKAGNQAVASQRALLRIVMRSDYQIDLAFYAALESYLAAVASCSYLPLVYLLVAC